MEEPREREGEREREEGGGAEGCVCVKTLFCSLDLVKPIYQLILAKLLMSKNYKTRQTERGRGEVERD